MHTPPSQLPPDEYSRLSQTPGYRILLMLSLAGDPPCHTQSHLQLTSQGSQLPPPRPPHCVASAQTPAGFVLKPLPAYSAQSNNFPKKPANRQLDGGGEVWGTGGSRENARQDSQLGLGLGDFSRP